MTAKASYSALDQLLSQQNRAIDCANNQIKQLETYLYDYANVKSKLTDYPSRVIKKAHIPFGPKAFAPGYFQHTNEVYALLGDNYFAYVSAAQAKQIVQRRIDKLNKDIDGLKDQNRLLNDRLNFTNEIHTEAIKKETTEIREEYDSDTEKEWRIQHAKRLRNAKSSQKSNSNDTISDEALMRHLEELEREEEKAERLGLIPALKKSSNTQMNPKKLVRFSDREEESDDNDQSESSSSEPLTDDDEEEESESAIHSSTRVIRFRHSQSYQPSTPVQASGDSSVNSPGNIFDRYLASSSEVSTGRPYSDVVIERDPNTATTMSSASRPKSKFSSMRSKR